MTRKKRVSVKTNIMSRSRSAYIYDWFVLTKIWFSHKWKKINSYIWWRAFSRLIRRETAHHQQSVVAERQLKLSALAPPTRSARYSELLSVSIMASEARGSHRVFSLFLPAVQSGWCRYSDTPAPEPVYSACLTFLYLPLLVLNVSWVIWYQRQRACKLLHIATMRFSLFISLYSLSIYHR